MADEELKVEKPAGQDDIEKNKVMAILAYLWILVLVPLLAAKDSPFARFHANQGLVLFIGETVIGILWKILLFLPIINLLVAILAPLVSLGFLILAIIGIINAAKGEMKELPIIGKFKILK
jgi:uncharacterized membrane protein